MPDLNNICRQGLLSSIFVFGLFFGHAGALLAQTTLWRSIEDAGLWYAPINWTRGVPDASTLARFNGEGVEKTILLGDREAGYASHLEFIGRNVPLVSDDTRYTIQGLGHAKSALVVRSPATSSRDKILVEAVSESILVELKQLTIESSDFLSVDNTNSQDYARLDLIDSHTTATAFLMSGHSGGTTVLRITGGSYTSSAKHILNEVSSNSRLITQDTVLDANIGNAGEWIVHDATFKGDEILGNGTIRVEPEQTFLNFDPGGEKPVRVVNSISGPGGVRVTSGAVTFVAPNSFSGGLLLDGGVAEVSSGSRLGSLEGYLQFSGGVLKTTGSYSISIPSFITGGGINTAGHDIDVNGDFTGSADGVFTKSGAGTLTLHNNGGDYPGDFLVASGTLVSGNGNSFSTSSTVAINAGATLRFDGAEYFDGLNGDGEVEVNGQTLRLGDNDTTTNDFAGQLVGGGTVIKDGTGSQRFSGDNSGFTGDFNLVDGSLIFASGESLGRDLVVPSGAKVEFDPESGESDYAHALSGPGVFEKDGAGALNVTGDSPDYSGYFFVGEGTVNIDGEISASEVAVVEGATVGGNGTINNLLYAEPASTISPGRSVGKLTAAEFRMDSGAVLAIEIASAGGAAGDDHDQLRVTGDAQIDDATLSVGLVDGFTPAHGDEFHLLDIAGAITGIGFIQFDLPEVPGMAWDTSGVLPEGLLAIEVSLPGDYNLDGAVDAADYTVWRDNVDAPAGTLASDIDGGVIGAAQYHTWRDNFGAFLANALTPAAVPEPSAAAALMVLTASLALRRRLKKCGCPAA